MAVNVSPVFVSPDVYGLRWINTSDAAVLSAWEKSHRSYPWSADQFLDTIDGRQCRTLVWEADGVLLGFAVFQLVGVEAYLLNIMIDPSRVRAGKGQRLLDNGLAWVAASGARVAYLDVASHNAKARRLYEKSGFHYTQRRKKAYPHGEDAFVMKKTLESK